MRRVLFADLAKLFQFKLIRSVDLVFASYIIGRLAFSALQPY